MSAEVEAHANEPPIDHVAVPRIVVTAGLTLLNFGFAGAIITQDKAPVTVTPLVRSSDLAAPVGTSALGFMADPALLREVLWKERRGKKPEWLRVQAIPTLMQILMPEDKPVRLLLVELVELPATSVPTARKS